MNDNNLFQKVIDNVDIVDYISETVTLTPKGKNFFGICPFHNDNNPSMSVSRERKIYHCFSCLEGGNVINFCANSRHISYLEAAIYLANKYNIDVSEFKNNKQVPSNDRFYHINEIAKNYYMYALRNLKDDSLIKTYLAKRRMDIDIIRMFSIGYADSSSSMGKTLESKNILSTDLIKLGLIKNEKDLFYDRIIFPIHDEFGRVVAFSGRIYKETKDEPKYINSPETVVFQKRNVLYNLHNAIRSIKEKGYVILYEGFMDVIAAYKASVYNAVASMGTNLTKEQVKLLKKYIDNIVICYDGDFAGVQATRQAIKLLEEEKFKIKILLMPEGLDPDEYYNKYGNVQFVKYLEENKIDKIDYYYLGYKNNYDINTPSGKEDFKNAVFREIKDLKSNTIYETYLKRLEKDLNISYESLSEDFKVFIGKKVLIKKEPIPELKIVPKHIKAEDIIINYMLYNNKYVKIAKENLGEFFATNSINRKIAFKLFDLYDQNKKASGKDVLKELGVIKDNFEGYKYQEEEFNDCITVLKYKQIDDEISIIKEKIKNTKDTDESFKLTNKMIELKRSKNGQK